MDKFISLDKPISDLKFDKLSRTEEVDRLSNILLGLDKSGSTVLIDGKWGIGKTSFKNFLIPKIDNKLVFINNIPHVTKVVHFSPWNVLTQDGIISQFFNTFTENFKYSISKTILKSLKERIFDSEFFKKLGKTIDEFLKTIPLYGQMLSIAANIAKCFAKYKKQMTKNKTELENKKEKLVLDLKKSFITYYVVIDDLDRLNTSEIRLVIQLIKAVCDFPNVNYILFADKDVIANSLNNEQNCNGYQYLEKIIQLEYKIPNLSNAQIFEILNEKKNLIISNMHWEDYFNEIKFQKFFVNTGLYTQISNIRQINKIVNEFIIISPKFVNKINLSEIFALVALFELYPVLRNLFIETKEYLCNNLMPSFLRLKDISCTDYIKNECRKYYTDVEISIVMSAIRILFPHNENDLKTDIEVVSNFDLFFSSSQNDFDASLPKIKDCIDKENLAPLIEMVKNFDYLQFNRFLNVLSDYTYLNGPYSYIKSILKILMSCKTNHFLNNKCEDSLNNLLISICDRADEYEDLFTHFYEKDSFNKSAKLFFLLFNLKHKNALFSKNTDKFVSLSKDLILNSMWYSNENFNLAILLAYEYYQDQLLNSLQDQIGRGFAKEVLNAGLIKIEKNYEAKYCLNKSFKILKDNCINFGRYFNTDDIASKLFLISDADFSREPMTSEQIIEEYKKITE